MQAGSRKNIDRMAEVVPEFKSRNLQQFITHSKWDARAVIDHVARDGNNLIGDQEQTGLLIDESAFAKQEKMSVGAARQRLGRVGNVDNGQVAVFGVLAKNRFCLPVDVRLYLYLPKQWIADPKRCDRAGIPEAERIFRTKDELALEIMAHARENGLGYAWVGADAGYGKGLGFCCALDRMGERFVVDLHSDFRVYLEAPKPYIPVKISKKGPKFTRYRVEEESSMVKDVVEAMKLSSQPVLKLRDTTRGTLKVRALRLPVYIWDKKAGAVHKYFLIATRTLGKKPETKISLFNVPDAVEFKTLAWMQLQRFWVERAFEDAKSECGMAD
jgi:SRSO17 transposase